jgi:hypothetical protein
MPPLDVTIWTLWHGREVAGLGTFDLLADAVSVQVPNADADLSIALSGLDGARVSPNHLTLYPTTGDVIELNGEGLEDLGRELRGRVCTLPELTLALRGLGSARAYPGPDHDRFFAPVLAARRSAAQATDPGGRMSAMRAPALAAEVERVLHEFAVARYPNDPAERRALETVFEDLSAPVRSSLAELDKAARAVTAASDDAAFVWWRAWAAECRAVVTQLDRCWLTIAPILKQTPIPEATAWHWPWRRSRGESESKATERRT